MSEVKIKVEDLTRLKEENKALKSSIHELGEKLQSLSEEELYKKAITYSWTLFDSYMGKVFEELGFDGEMFMAGPVRKEDLAHWLGDKWWTSDRVDVTIGADITNKFRRAFLRLGIKTKEEEDKKSSRPKFHDEKTKA